MFIKLDDRQAARWQVIASFHFQAIATAEAKGDTSTANWHRDAYGFMTHMVDLAVQARKDGTCTCPICDGKGVI
jgi:hypothetical protein